jgi:hypothetical protein
MLAALTTAAAPAAAAPAPVTPAAAGYNTCGSTCYGKDPYATGCINGSYVANAIGLFDAAGRQLLMVENWYSPACGTNWGFAYTYDVSAADMQTSRIDEPYQATCVPAVSGSENCGAWCTMANSYIWTDMVFGVDSPVRVCGCAGTPGTGSSLSPTGPGRGLRRRVRRLQHARRETAAR